MIREYQRAGKHFCGHMIFLCEFALDDSVVEQTGMSRHSFTHKKRKSSGGPSAREDESDQGIELQPLRDRVRELEKELEPLRAQFKSEGVPDMMKGEGERRRLAVILYTGDYAHTLQLLRDQNEDFVALLRAQMGNTSPETESSIAKTERHIDGVLVDNGVRGLWRQGVTCAARRTSTRSR